MQLTAENVSNVFSDCLFKDGEDHSNFIEAHGITISVGFNPVKLKENEEKIKDLLGQLPETFFDKRGGGWSFLQACVDSTGRQWGEHMNMQELFLLGIGIGLVQECLPKEFWGALPGGVPYYVITSWGQYD